MRQVQPGIVNVLHFDINFTITICCFTPVGSIPVPVDPSGRRTPENDPEGDFTLNADMVITALGFEAEDLPVLFNAPDLNVTRWGTIRVDHMTQMTNLDGVFAIGDIVRGASLVVWAIRDGRDVTQHMHNYLKSKASREKVAA